jgi:probable F420-dependent oxidoreductase
MMPGEVAVGPDDIRREWCQVCTEFGVESIWISEHIVIACNYAPVFPYRDGGKMTEEPTAPRPDALTVLTWIGAGTSTLRLGTAVLIAPLHNPVILAKRAATLSSLSGGRLLLGLGMGWQSEEYSALGVPFRDRGERIEECVGAMRALWSQEPATFQGRFVKFTDAYCLPRPESGVVPIILAGNGSHSVLRAARIADGWFPLSLPADEFSQRCDELRAQSSGRSVPVEITAWPGSAAGVNQLSLKDVRPYVSAGAKRIIAGIPSEDGHGVIAQLRATLTALQENVLCHL